MGHIVLYRKYRPINFKDVIGQEHVTNILQRQIATKTLSHAYIFSGTRGTGKTSVAKIFARAVNCLDSQDGEPCNKCINCKQILSNASTDIEELDAASNNSVDDVRNIRQDVAYTPTSGKYKVYIIDEAHMLTKNAFNALLKTIEEPPEQVIFILATTEEQKLIPTIRSRCLRFEFKRLGEDDIAKGLESVLNDMKIEYEIEALKYIANVADGSMRDALSILERCIDDKTKKIEKEKIKEILGAVPIELVNNLLEAVLSYNIVDTRQYAGQLMEGGKDARYVASIVNEQLMNILVYVASKGKTKIEQSLSDTVKNVSIKRINSCIKSVSRLDEGIRLSTNPSNTFMAGMLELASDVVIENTSDMKQKIEQMQLKIEQLENKEYVIFEQKSVSPAIPTSKEVQVIEQNNENEKAEEIQKNIPKLKPFKELERVQKLASESDKIQLFSALSGAKAFVDGDKILFHISNNFSYSLLKKEDTHNDLKHLLFDVTQKEYEIELYHIEEKKEQSKFEQMLKDTGVPFTLEK